MSGFWERLLGRGNKGSGATAKQRLQFVLVHDRMDLPPEKLALMKQEILAVISKYVNVDEDHVDIALQQGDRRGSMLVAEIPFTKTAEGIEQDDPELKIEISVPTTAAEQETAKPEAGGDKVDKTENAEIVEEVIEDNDKTEQRRPPL
jgi:cell division topological specificity factor